MVVLDHFVEGESLLREAIEVHQLAVPPDGWQIALARVEHGRALTALRRRRDAEAEFLAGARGLEGTNEFSYAAGALGAFYTDWDQMEPNQGYDAKAREWFLKSVNGYIRPLPDAENAKDEQHKQQN